MRVIPSGKIFSGLLVSLTLATSAFAEADTRGSCITTPEQYQKSWESYEQRCVDPSLFGTVHDASSTWVYPEGFSYAWAGSNTNLEMYLELQHLYGDPSKPAFNPHKVNLGIVSIIGFPQITSLNDDFPMSLGVYKVSADEEIQVPSFQTWFRVMEEDWGLRYPLDAQTDLVLAYSQLSPGEDVVGVYEEVTGCNREAMITEGQFIGCNKDYTDAVEAAGKSPYEGGGTPSCFRNFFTHYRGPLNASAIRGVFSQCQDTGFLNTGVGLGYNTYPNPFVCKPTIEQTVDERYTGREFILRNRQLTEFLSYVDIPLSFDGKFHEFLVTGYCSD